MLFAFQKTIKGLHQSLVLTCCSEFVFLSLMGDSKSKGICQTEQGT